MNFDFLLDILNALAHPFVAQGLLTVFILLKSIQCIKKTPNIILCHASKTLLAILAIYVFYAHVRVDLRYLFVMQNNHPAQAIHYRIASLWSHHETSLFIWLIILNSTTYILRLPHHISQFRERILGLLNCLFCFYMLVAANPFEMTPIAQLTQESQGLNPLLYDINMVWHPPLLYLGTTWLFTPYVIGLWLRRTGDMTYVSCMQQQTKTAFGFLTLAIALGSFWAFTQLGWGGFWFWDPVETASLLPWLSALIIFHVNPLTLKKHPWIGCLPFAAVMISLWSVRSGLFASVHSFANDTMAFWLLGALMIFTWAPILVILSQRLKTYNPKINILDSINKLKTISGHSNKDTQRDSKDGTRTIGIYLLALTLLLLVFGLFVPVILDISVAPTFFNTLLLPIWIPIALLMARALYNHFHFNTSTTAILLGCIFYLTFYSHLAFSYLLLGISGTVCASATIPFIKEKPVAAFSHMGIGLCLIGLASHSVSPPEVTLTLSRNIPLMHHDYQLTFKNTYEVAEPFKTNQYAHIAIQTKKGALMLAPARQFFHSSKLQRVKADFGLLNQHIVMITNNETLPDGRIAITFHEKVGLLWLVFGCGLIVASLLTRKLSNIVRHPILFQ